MEEFVIVPVKIFKCSECPFYKYEGTSWSEDIYICSKLNIEVDPEEIDYRCPYLENNKK
jgi:hypothetical protein